MYVAICIDDSLYWIQLFLEKFIPPIADEGKEGVSLSFCTQMILLIWTDDPLIFYPLNYVIKDLVFPTHARLYYKLSSLGRSVLCFGNNIALEYFLAFL